MNTMPDETTLARWLDDDLQGAELAAFETAIHGDAGLLAKRQAARAWRADVAAALPAALEPPYPEFFNYRIEKALREQALPVPQPRKASMWRAWWMPATALAGMALAFWTGTMTHSGVTPQVAVVIPAAVPVSAPVQVPTVYTPERGVDAEWFSSSDAAATVIVLEGVDAIPDTLDFSESVGGPGEEESTARLESSNDEAAEVPQ